MVEGEWWQLIHRVPCGFGGIGIAGGGVVLGANEGVVGDADDASARVAVGVAEGVELFEENVFDVGFFFEFAAGGLVESFLHVDEATGESPCAEMRLDAAPDEEDLKNVTSKAEDHAIDRERGAGVFVGEGHGG